MGKEPVGKRVLVTGGTRGIGRAIVLAMARGGARIVTCARTPTQDAASLELQLKELNTGYRFVACDVTEPTDVERLADACRSYLGGLDVVVNNAGRDGETPLDELTEPMWREVLDADLTSVFLVTRGCLPLLAPGASVINISSGLALRGRAGRVHYTAAKAGVLGLSRTLCKELGPRGIRINVIAPGIIATEPGDEHPPAEVIKHMTALGRPGAPEDVAAAAVYLASDAAGYVTGAVLNVDGGM
jgi:3-oxoacyl-[acyl-carrier protein] reductase